MVIIKSFPFTNMLQVKSQTELPNGLKISEDKFDSNILLDHDVSTKKFFQFIRDVTDKIYYCLDQGISPVVIFPLKGSIIHYFFLMEELVARGFKDFDSIEILFSYKSELRSGDQQAYEESRKAGGDPEEYSITKPTREYGPERPVIIVEDLKETGSSVDSTMIAYWKAVGLERRRPKRKAIAAYAAVKHMPKDNGKYQVQHSIPLFSEGTINLNSNWLTAGIGLDGGITDKLTDEELIIAIEIAERISARYIEKIDSGTGILNNNEDGRKYLRSLFEHSIVNLPEDQIQENILYKLYYKVITRKSPEQMLRFMQRVHSLAVNRIQNPNLEA